MLELKKEQRDDQAIGRSARGLSTKIHAACDATGNPTGFHLTPGQAHDLQGVYSLMDELVKAESVLAHKAYDADERISYKLEANGVLSVIPQKSRVDPLAYDKDSIKPDT